MLFSLSWFLVLVDLRLAVTGCDADGFFVCFFDAAGFTETGCDANGLTVLFIASDGPCSTRTCYHADGLTVGDVYLFRPIFL